MLSTSPLSTVPNSTLPTPERVSQVVAEALVADTPNLVQAQLVAQALVANSPGFVPTQVVAEVLVQYLTRLTSTQIVVEVLNNPGAVNMEASHIVGEILTWFQTAGQSASTTWNIKSIGSKSASTSWNTYARYFATPAFASPVFFVPGWNPYVSASRDTTWDVASGETVVGDSRDTTWNAQALAFDDRDTTWHVYSLVNDSRDTTWNVSDQITVGDTRDTTWNVISHVDDDRDTTWNVHTVVSKNRSTTWNVHTDAEVSRDTTWNVVGVASQQAEAIWNVDFRPAVQIAQEFADVLTTNDPTVRITRELVEVLSVADSSIRITKALTEVLALETDTDSSVRITRENVYVVTDNTIDNQARATQVFVDVLIRPTARRQGNVSWNDLAHCDKVASATWNAHTLISKSISSTWNVTTSVNVNVETTWNASAVVSASVDTTWNVVGHVSDGRVTLWDIHTSVFQMRTTGWNTSDRTTVTINAGVSWNTDSYIIQPVGPPVSALNVNMVGTYAIVSQRRRFVKLLTFHEADVEEKYRDVALNITVDIKNVVMEHQAEPKLRLESIYGKIYDSEKQRRSVQVQFRHRGSFDGQHSGETMP